MLTFSKLEKKGNLGNQLFQIAAVIGIASENRTEFAFPVWSSQRYFKNHLPVSAFSEKSVIIESQFHYEPVLLDDSDYDLEGYFQSEKYFNRHETKKYFEFTDELVESVRKICEKALAKSTIVISIRRGDFVDHPDYFQLPINFYINALNYHFPEWRQRNLVILSDDSDYCKFHFSFLTNAYFGDSLSGIQQMVLASLCDDFIISNSTFSWWCAWLGEKVHTKIIRPEFNFTVDKNSIDNDKDYFPDRWIKFASTDHKIILPNTKVTFFDKNPSLIEYYIKNFSFTDSEKSKDKNNTSDSLTAYLYIEEFLIPPLCLSEAVFSVQSQKFETIAYLKGQPITISELLDFSFLKRQFDFGIFTKILDTRNNETKQKILFFCSQFEIDRFSLRFSSYEIRENVNKLNTFYSYAGKIGPALLSKYFLAVNSELIIKRVKRSLKKLLGIKK